MQKKADVLSTIKERKVQYFGHSRREEEKYELLQLIVQDKKHKEDVEPEDRRHSRLRNLRDLVSLQRLIFIWSRCG